MLEKLQVGPLATNCYIVWCPKSLEAAIVDPGFEGEKVLLKVSELGVRAVAVLLTHGHFDHATEAEAVARGLKVRVMLHRQDEAQFRIVLPPGNLVDGQIVAVGSGSLVVIHTPGHSRGSVCFHDAIGSTLLSGDTLFRRGVGRTDFPGGSQREILQSIRQRLLVLPPETRVCPGHGAETSILEEGCTSDAPAFQR